MISALIASSLLLFAPPQYDPILYQLGSTWDKSPVTESMLTTASPAFQRAALATAFIPVAGGTAFYLGKFNGVHVIATNHHVCETGPQCLGFDLNFPLLQKTYRLDRWLGTFKDIDLTLMTFQVPAADEALLAPLAANFSFQKDVRLGEKLTTIGFGVAGNPTRQMVGDSGDDCRVLSGTAEYRLLHDPDAMNPMPDPVWSFAAGCDVSHGDSGSAMIDRETGEVMGILWTGKTPKSPKVQNSTYLESLLAAPNEEVWTELSYAVPAAKMASSIYTYAYHYPYMTPEVQATLLKIIEQP